MGIPMQTRVAVPFWGTRAEIAEVIALARAGHLKAHAEQFPLASAQRRDKLEAHPLHGRAVVVPRAVTGRPPTAHR